MKKILFVINTLGRGGAENALMTLLKKINPDEFEIHLLVVLGQGELIDRVPSHVKILNENYDSESVLSNVGKKHLKKNVFRLMFNNNAVFKNFFYIICNAFRMLCKGRILTDKLLWRTLSDASIVFDTEYDFAVAYIEGASAYYVKDHVKSRRKIGFIHVNYTEAGYTRELDKDVYLGYDKVFAVSEDVKDSFLNLYPECAEKTDIFENIIDREEILKRGEEQGGFSDSFDGKRILTIARLNPQKALDISIEACKKLVDKNENVKWYVLGEGDLRSKLEDLIRKEGLTDIFILMGVKDNPYTFLKQCDFYVHASRYEGKSIAIREAQIFGKPIIVSDCRSNLEQVMENEDALVCKLNPDSLEQKIEELLHDEELCLKLGSNASKKYLEYTDEIDKLFK